MDDKSSKGRILIVDDQSGIRESMSDVLLIEGYEVFTFESGFAAIEKAKEVSFDVAFLDIKMPGINGVDTFRGIKKYSPETVVFMITANAEQELIDAAISEGAYDIISKPFDMNLIIDTVRDSQQKTAILMVNDEKQFIEKTRQDLIKKGYKVVTVSDEKQARESFSRKAEEMVLVNVKGHLNPDEIFQKIKNITGEEDPRIIMINSSTDNGDMGGEVITVATKKLRDKVVDMGELKTTLDGILREKKLTEKASVMIIIDDKVLANAISIELGHHGYDITVVPDLAQAVKQLENANFNLVLMDPVLNAGGPAMALEKLKVSKPDMEVVFIPSGHNDADNKAKYNYLYKPFDNARVLALVKEICATKRRKDNVP